MVFFPSSVYDQKCQVCTLCNKFNTNASAVVSALSGTWTETEMLHESRGRRSGGLKNIWHCSSSDWRGPFLSFSHFVLLLFLSSLTPSLLFNPCSLHFLFLRYLSYGSGPKRFPLADVLQYAMEFASSKPVCTSPVEDIDSSTPPGGATGQQLPPPR